MKDRHRMQIFGLIGLIALFDINSKVFAESVSQIHKNSSITPENSKKTKASAQWRTKMQELYQILAQLTTDSSSDERFNAPENRSRIEKNTKKLADRAHDLTLQGIAPDDDPTIKMVAGLFQDEARRAYWAVKAGNRSYARSIINQVSSYCITCHTRNSSGVSFSSLPLEPSTKNLNPIEQGRFYAATRQYDRALNLFQKVVNDPQAPIEKPLQWEQAVRYGLAIAIRVKKDPDEARALVERVIESPKAPFFLKQDALKWREGIKKWKEEIPRRALTEEGLRTEAIQLLTQAREHQKYPMDHGGDIHYLRASAVVHELLQKFPDGRYAQEALLMAGMCYDALRSLSLGDLHEIYYEACIKKTPHTPTAEACYQRYEQSTYEGYTGSAGTYLPDDVKEKLFRLENLAHPETSEEKPKLH